MTKKWMLAVLMGSVLLTQMPNDAFAKRLGGGGSSGMKRAVPTQPAQRTPDAPAQNAAPGKPNQAQQGTTAGAAPAAAPKRNWMGPIAGLAAGLGLAALMSHFGMGEAFSNFLMMALLAVAAVFVIGWLMRRFGKGAQRPAGGGLAYAGAGAGAGTSPSPFQRQQPAAAPQNTFRQAETSFSAPAAQGHVPVAFDPALNGGVIPGASATLPADFDQPGFERLARMIFIRMQAANDAADLNDLRTFTTPELFAAIRVDLQDRGTQRNVTDVVDVTAEVLDLAEEGDRQIVSVRYHGRIRETEGGTAEPFDEIWHLVKPIHGDGQWAIAGIQQTH